MVSNVGISTTPIVSSLSCTQFSLLTHLLEDISAAADLAQQLPIGDGQVMVGLVPFPEKDNGQER